MSYGIGVFFNPVTICGRFFLHALRYYRRELMRYCQKSLIELLGEIVGCIRNVNI
jgi:hypothetical protein